MKLKIRSDVISNLKHILEKKITFNYRFGNKFRTGFSSSLNIWDYKCLKEFLEFKYSFRHTKVGKRYYKQICDLGFIRESHVILYEIKEDEGDDYIINTFETEKYDIKLITKTGEYQVEIKLRYKPETISDIFEPVKFLYGIFKSRISLVIDNKDKIIEEYNCLFEKNQKSPWISPQGLNFINIDNFKTLKDYIVMPLWQGVKYMLFLSSKGAYMISKREIFVVDFENVPEQLQGSVVVGYWYNKKFTVNDILVFGLKDIRKLSLLKRFEHLLKVSKLFPFCVMINFFNRNIYHYATLLLQKHDGVIFYPIKANYTNDKVFIYQPVEKIGIKFRVQNSFNSKFQTFCLTCGNNNDFFNGTKEYPYKYLIALSIEDRDFIGTVDDNTVFEFRWESDCFMPYVCAPKNSISSSNFSKKAWQYINNPI